MAWPFFGVWALGAAYTLWRIGRLKDVPPFSWATRALLAVVWPLTWLAVAAVRVDERR